MKNLFLIGIVALGACQSSDSGKAAKPSEPAVAQLANTCFLGHQAAGGDSILVCIASASERDITGTMKISIPEKDSRSGVIAGQAGDDGIIRATYRFMQEGITDSIEVQFRIVADSPDVLMLRRSAYDATTGREYPDSTRQDFIPLRRVPAQAG